MSTTLRQQVRRRQMELSEFRALPLITRQDVNLEFQQELSDINISKSQEATSVTFELVRASMEVRNQTWTMATNTIQKIERVAGRFWRQ
jgi:hypothetical protein